MAVTAPRCRRRRKWQRYRREFPDGDRVDAELADALETPIQSELYGKVIGGVPVIRDVRPWHQ